MYSEWCRNFNFDEGMLLIWQLIHSRLYMFLMLKVRLNSSHQVYPGCPLKLCISYWYTYAHARTHARTSSHIKAWMRWRHHEIKKILKKEFEKIENNHKKDASGSPLITLPNTAAWLMCTGRNTSIEGAHIHAHAYTQCACTHKDTHV